MGLGCWFGRHQVLRWDVFGVAVEGSGLLSINLPLHFLAHFQRRVDVFHVVLSHFLVVEYVLLVCRLCLMADAWAEAPLGCNHATVRF